MEVICWWSGGVTSAVACKIASDLFGVENCRFIMIDTLGNEDEDTYRFKQDCEKWYGTEIESIKSDNYNSIQEVWYRNNSLNIAKGAVCSSRLKREVTEKWMTKNPDFTYQVFGFDINEVSRAKSMSLNNAKRKPIYPLLFHVLSKKDCINILLENGINPPVTYQYGFHNNNCFKTGCVQGGIGYWQKMQKEFPDKFDAMAKVEHDLTDRKGKPVTMLKTMVKGEYEYLFLKPHKDYPDIKHIGMVKGHPVKPLMECNGFCGSNDLSQPNPTANELNFDEKLKTKRLF